MRMFQQSVRDWYSIDTSDHDVNGIFKPLSAMRSMNDELAWSCASWMHWMQGVPVAENVRLAMQELSWRVSLALRDRQPQEALEWLAFWETLHHTRAQYSKRSGCDEYELFTRLDYVPQHTAQELDTWQEWFSQTALQRVQAQQDFVQLVPFFGYYPWLNAIALSCPAACHFIENAIEATFTDYPLGTQYAQLQWIVWSIRNRHPNEAYDNHSLMHRLFDQHSLLQLACFWYNGQKNHPACLLPNDIPKVWQRPLFAGSDITDAESPEWQQAWIDVIATPHWARRLSFWVTLVRVRRTKSTPLWLEDVVRAHPEEWHFFETMHSWMSQMPPYLEPILSKSNMEHFHAVCLNYEYEFAHALWKMYNNDERIEVLPLPLLED